MSSHARAGKPPHESTLIDLARLQDAYFDLQPDPADSGQRVAFGTSGHRGSSLTGSFNEAHIAAVTQALCEYRVAHGIHGPLFLAMDTHGLSPCAFETALEVLVAHGVETMIPGDSRFTPTPAVSRAILRHNAGRRDGLADGIVITPSHNPPEDGGFKYNPPSGGPADKDTTQAVEDRANEILEGGLNAVRRVPLKEARQAGHAHRFDYLDAYVSELGEVIDMALIRERGVKLGVDPLGGAGIDYWGAIADRYSLDLTVVNQVVDPTFAFMTADWDGKLRMDPSSPYVMQGLLDLKESFDVAVACDADHDRHGIVTRSAGLLPPNHYLAVMVDYLFRHRAGWRPDCRVGKTVVTSHLVDRVAEGAGRQVYETPVGFKWFVDGLLEGSLGVGVEESAGASFLKQDGTVWTTDKDGIVAGLLAAEITAREGRDPGELYDALTGEFGTPCYRRVDAPADARQKAVLSRLAPEQVRTNELAGEPIVARQSEAAGNGAPIGGLKVVAGNAWFAARPSGTEDVYKIYAESFRGEAHLAQVLEEAQAIVGDVLRA